MKSLTQVFKRIKTICLYVICYLLCSIIIISLFSWIYDINGVSESWRISFEVFWNIKIYYDEVIINWIYIEQIVNNLFSLILVGGVLAKLLAPLNPIIFSDYVIYDTVDRKMSLQYWIMLPKGKYLYDIKMKLLLTEYETHQKGINKIEPLWECREQDLELDLARGIRFITLTEKDSTDIIKTIEEYYDRHIQNGKFIGGNCSIDLSIRGTSENGTTYHAWHRYKRDDILLGYRYVPMQRHSYDTKDFYGEEYLTEDEKKKINPSEDFYKAGKQEFFRYQHFGKVYRLRNSANSEKAKKKHDILSKEEIIHGQFFKPYQLIVDLASFITWFFLDSDRKMRWVLKKIAKYLLHISHIKRF